jgi:signal transduction histidine kinase
MSSYLLNSSVPSARTEHPSPSFSRSGDAKISLYDVSLPARRAIRKVYRHLIELTYLLRPWLDNPDFPTVMAEMRLRTFVRTAKWPRIIDTLQRISPSASAHDERIQRVMHDIRGGALTSLTLYLQMAEQGDLLARDIPQLVLLANDHAKILRSMIVDLDRIRYTLDEIFRPQSAQQLVTTWHQKHYRMPTGHAAMIAVDCTIPQVVIADSVIELAALERIVYNLINNAVRHADTPNVQLTIQACPTRSRIAQVSVANTISPSQYAKLCTLCPDHDFSRLVTESLSTTNGGLGLGICADIVAHMFHCDSLQAVMAAGLFTLTCTPNQFIVTAAWPLGRQDG